MNATVETGRTLADYKGLLRRRRRYLLTIIPASLLVAIFIAYVLPPKYRASGTIMLEDSQLPQNVVSTQVTQDDDSAEKAAQTLELLRRKVMDKDSLLAVVKQVDPYPNLPLSPAQKANQILEDSSVERVDPLTFQPLEQSKAFSIHYLNPDPKIAAVVDQKLVDLFVTFNQRTRQEASREAYQFLEAQAKQLEQSMAGQEKQLAQFKAKYGDALPEAEARNLAGEDRARRDLDALQHDIIQAEQQESQFQVQLSSISPSLEAAVSDWSKELAKTRGDLAEAEQKYTPEHPDVKRLRRAVADLLAKGAGGGGVKGAAPDNPDYLAVQSQLTGVRRQLASLRSQEEKARADLAGYEKNLATAPNVEREYISLSREHENAQNSYTDLQNKMKNAALAQSLETESRGERFTLLRPAVPPTKPYFPNRLGIILLGAVLGCGIAFGIAAAVDASDPTLRGNSDLQMIMQTSAIGSIPNLLNPKDLWRRKLVWGSAIAGFTAATAFVAVTVLARI
jgi:polysaccharide chain length determinant protein (PEP-CTERM system associated)